MLEVVLRYALRCMGKSFVWCCKRACRMRSCQPASANPLIKMYRRAWALKGVKKILISSGAL
jgi:hypothetical protein